eukprot:gene10769-13180_t
MRLFPRSALLLAVATATALTPIPAKTLIHVGSLIDARADTPQKSVTLTIDGERITAVTPGYTAPAAGETFKFARPEVMAYLAYLDTAQDAVVASVGDAPVLAKYTNVFNGFAASLTESQALLLANNPNVSGIWEDEA